MGDFSGPKPRKTVFWGLRALWRPYFGPRNGPCGLEYRFWAFFANFFRPQGQFDLDVIRWKNHFGRLFRPKRPKYRILASVSPLETTILGPENPPVGHKIGLGDFSQIFSGPKPHLTNMTSSRKIILGDFSGPNGRNTVFWPILGQKYRYFRRKSYQKAIPKKKIA